METDEEKVSAKVTAAAVKERDRIALMYLRTIDPVTKRFLPGVRWEAPKEDEC